jgi:ubiquinone/menaquinone biosynthesis C-methylase UbiE
VTHQRIAGVFAAWAQTGRAVSMARAHGDVVRQVVAQLPFASGHRALDLGCGNGWATRMLAGKARDVRAIGIDCAGEMVARARRITDSAQPLLAPRPLFVNGRFEALPFADDAAAMKNGPGGGGRDRHGDHQQHGRQHDQQ